jgi:uncharacterized membrane protein
MVLMAIDHASFFIARVHPAESWAYGPPYYASSAAFVTRWITHLCAPGFFFLMGAGMAIFAASRIDAGWTRRRVTRFLATRGAVLLVVQHFIENPAWLLGILSAAPEFQELAPAPGDRSDIYANFAVITALGAGMIVWGVLVAAPSAVIAIISVAALTVSMLVTPDPSQATVAYSFPLRILFIPGQSSFVSVVYPVVPWLLPAGLGILFARHIAGRPSLLERRAALLGAALIVMFIVLRAAGLGDYHAAAPGVIGFLTVTKYPPSLDFFAVMLGIDLVLLGLLSRPLPAWAAGPLQVFGRVPFFFYLLHLYVFGALSWLFPRGTSFAVMYAIWLAALVAMYPACRWYARFKGSKPPTSMWRLF